MKLTLFAKKRTNKEGKHFYTYLSKLTKKDGNEITVSVKFRESCGSPKGDECPCNILVTKKDCNLSENTYVLEDTGEIATSYTLWVNNWTMGEKYEDDSLNDFDFN